MTNEPGALRLTSLGLAEEEGVVLGEATARPRRNGSQGASRIGQVANHGPHCNGCSR